MGSPAKTSLLGASQDWEEWASMGRGGPEEGRGLAVHQGPCGRQAHYAEEQTEAGSYMVRVPFSERSPCPEAPIS